MLTVEINEHLEEVDLRQIARGVLQRHEHFPPLSLPLAHAALHEGVADLVPFFEQHRRAEWISFGAPVSDVLLLSGSLCPRATVAARIPEATATKRERESEYQSKEDDDGDTLRST